MDKKRLIIVSDYGLDDAVALVYLLPWLERFDGADIICAAGNVTAARSLINAYKLILEAGARGKVRLVHTLDCAYAFYSVPSVHGGDGMGDLLADKEIGAEKIPAESLKDYLKSVPARAAVLSLAPATAALEIVKRIKDCDLTVMGGVTEAAPNFKGTEFNQALDKKAFAELVKFPHKIATLDTCRAKNLNLALVRFPETELLYRLINRANALKEARHADNSFLYDLTAALCLIRPELFTAQTAADKFGNVLTQLKINADFNLEQFLQKQERKGLE